VRLLLSRLPANVVNARRTTEKVTALYFAALQGHPSTIELLLSKGADPALTEVHGYTALQHAHDENHPVCARMLDPHKLLPLLLPWSVERFRGVRDGAVVSTSVDAAGTTTVTRARLTYPPPFNLAALTLFRQVSPHCAPAIAPNPARGVLGIGRMAGMPTCTVRDPITRETRDVDLLQEHIFASGMLDLDWFTVAPKRRLLTWLPAPRRLALRHWEAGDTVEVCGLKSAPELNGRMAVVKGYLPKQRRFQCLLVETEEEKGKGKNNKGGKKKKHKKKKVKPLALRAENLVVRFCKKCGKHGTSKLLACGGCGLAHYCGAGCQKAGWRAHKVLC
jgi:hypothetical protein